MVGLLAGKDMLRWREHMIEEEMMRWRRMQYVMEGDCVLRGK